MKDMITGPHLDTGDYWRIGSLYRWRQDLRNPNVRGHKIALEYDLPFEAELVNFAKINPNMQHYTKQTRLLHLIFNSNNGHQFNLLADTADEVYTRNPAAQIKTNVPLCDLRNLCPS